MTVYERIKHRRLSLNMSQQELAELLGYQTASAVNKVEMGLRDITTDKLMEYAVALKTTPAYLMGWESSAEATKNDIITDIILRLRKDDEFLKVTETIMNLPDEQFAAVQTMLSVIK